MFFRVEDTFASSDRLAALDERFDGDTAHRAVSLWVRAGSTCALNRSGRITRAQLAKVAGMTRDEIDACAAALIEVGLWHHDDSDGVGWRFVKWDHYNGSSARRNDPTNAERQARFRAENRRNVTSNVTSNEKVTLPNSDQFNSIQSNSDQSFAKAKLSSANPETFDARREFSDSNLEKPETAQAAPQSTQEGDPLPNPIRDENVKPSATSCEQSTKQKRDAGSDERVREVFDFWRTHLDHPNAILGSSRKSKIAARLREGYTVEELSDAIRGCKRSRYHQGENDAGKIYDDIELICRSASKVDYFVGLLDARPARASAPAPRIISPAEVERPAYVPIGKDEQPVGFDSYGVPIFASQQRARTA